ncbi:hypothetical protein LX32DRAFT_309455 [Colletotrichum zoysiae]|uniref:Uncharacterized protein n=1 Tax=Colletotrichum zoysiae TaxID=1216348 RepID=A0AAD9HU07_9PEZI|nr:hypothetical protein LX32DRAFT_309455 [Colletotrichum zoysiae]
MTSTMATAQAHAPRLLSFSLSFLYVSNVEPPVLRIQSSQLHPSQSCSPAVPQQQQKNRHRPIPVLEVHTHASLPTPVRGTLHLRLIPPSVCLSVSRSRGRDCIPNGPRPTELHSRRERKAKSVMSPSVRTTWSRHFPYLGTYAAKGLCSNQQ